MSVITTFQNRLQAINASILAEPLPDLAEEMARTAQRLRVEYGDISRGGADQRGIAVAVANYLRTRTLPDSYRDLKYLCFGAASEYGAPLTRLIEETTLFNALLDTVETLTAEPRKLRRCYQGLLKTYFRYPGHRSSRSLTTQGWLAMELRAFPVQLCWRRAQQGAGLAALALTRVGAPESVSRPCKPATRSEQD